MSIFALLFIVAIVVTAIVTMCGRGIGVWAPFGLAVLLALVVMLIVVRSYEGNRVRVPLEAQVAQVFLGAQISAEAEPVDELWDKVNQPKIQLSTTTTEEAASTASHEAPTTKSAEGHGPASAVVASAAADNVATTTEDAQSASTAHEAPAPATPSTQPAPASTLEPKPSWVTQPPGFQADGSYQLVVQAGPYMTSKECHDELRREIHKAVSERIQSLASNETGRPYLYVPDLQSMSIGDKLIDGEIVSKRWLEPVSAHLGPMMTEYALLTFTDHHDRRLVEAWLTYARRDRLAMTVAISAFVLAVLGFALLLLKVDTWTRGYYSKRLFLGVPAAIIAVLVLAALVVD